MFFKNSLIFALTLLSFSSAHALFEARLTYGYLVSAPALKDVYTGTSTEAPTTAPLPSYGLGVDALFIFPIAGIGVGARYENLGFKVDAGGGLEYKTSTTRTALVLNYRLLNTFFFLGPIATYGLSHSNNVQWSVTSASLSVPNGTKADLTPQSSTSYSLGLELGVKMLNFMIGAEAGYEYFQWKKMSDATGTLTTNPDFDMNGFYSKVIFGFGI